MGSSGSINGMDAGVVLKQDRRIRGTEVIF